MSKSIYAIEPITSEDEVARLKEDWDHLSRDSDLPNVFTTYDWFQAWYKRFAHEKESRWRPNVLVLKKNGIITGISPLVYTISSRIGVRLRRLQFASRNHEWDYNDLVLGDDTGAQTEAVIGYLSQSVQDWELIDLRDLRDTGSTIAEIKRALVRFNLRFHLTPEVERSPFMAITGPWSNTMTQHSRFTRRVHRRFAELASEGYRVRIVENPEREPDLLGRMIALESQKRVGGKLSIPFLGAHQDVFQRVFETLGSQGWITVVLLEWNNRIFAWSLIYRCGKKLWGYVTAYDHDFSKISPGTVLLSAVIDYGFQHGFDEFDFMNGEEAYKARWTSASRQTYRLMIWNRRWKSRLIAYRNLRVLTRSVSKRTDDTPQTKVGASL